VVLSLIATATSSLRVFPHQLAYFNEIAGGPQNGHRHLLHSNLDWGQGLICLNSVLEQHKDWGPVAISYAGPFSPDLVGARVIPIDNGTLNSPLSSFSHVAISSSYLWRDSKQMRSPASASQLAKCFVEFVKDERPIHRLDESILLYETASFNATYHRLISGEKKAHGASVDIASSSLHLPSLANAVGIERPSVSSLLHMLMLFGLGETGLPKPATGAEALRILTDENLGRAYFGESPLIRTRNGLRYRCHLLDPPTAVDSAESHRDQCLATFAQLGLSLDEVVRLESGSYSLRDFLSESIANFTFEQGEMPWTAVAYSHYVAPTESWTDRFGRTTTFSELLLHLMEVKPESQSCAGFHVIQAILEIVNADSKYGILTPSSRVTGRKYVSEVLSALYRNQEAHGSWNFEWQRPVGVPLKARPTLLSKLVATGHSLEVFHELLQVPHTQPIVRSTKWMMDTLPRLDCKGNEVSVCALTHALKGVKQSSTNRDMSLELVELFSQ